MRQVSFLLLLCFMTSGCAAYQTLDWELSSPPHMRTASDKPGAMLAKEAAEPALTAEGSPRLTLAVVEPRKIVYTGNLVVVVGDVPAALEATQDLAESMGGYMQRLTEKAIVIRVPAGRFDEAVAELAGMGDVLRKDVTAQDVTEEYTDLEIRLRNARGLLEKLRGLLDKAARVEDALAVEKEIARVTTEIERLEGQLNRLRNQVAFATLAVTFTPIAEAPDEVKVRLPFWWLGRLGVESLLKF